MPGRVLLFLGALAVSAFTIRRGIELFDEGVMLQAASRVADGQLPYRDFAWAYGPAHPFLLGGIFEGLGPSLMAWRVVRVLVDAGVAVTVFALVRREAPLPVALAAWLGAAAAMAEPTGPSPFAPALLFALLSVLAARDGWPGAAGALAAAAGAFRLDFGVYAALGAVLALAAVREEVRVRLVRFGVTASGGLALVYGWVAVAIGPADAWEELVGASLREGSQWRLPFPLGYDGSLSAWPPGDALGDAKDVLEFYVPLLLVAGAVLAVAAWLARRVRPSPTAAGLAGLGAGSLAYLLSRIDEFHAAPLLVVLLALLPLAWGTALGRPLRAGIAVVFILLFAYGAANRVSALLRPPDLDRIDVAVADGVRARPAYARAVEGMVRAVQARVPPGEPIYTVTLRSDLVRVNAPLIYVLAQRRNPFFHDFALQTSAAAQRKLVTALERVRPRVIVRWTDPFSVQREPNARGTPSGSRVLDEWLEREYRSRARHGDFTILEPVQRLHGADGGGR